MQKIKSIHPTIGFGVPVTKNPHHFAVIIPRSNSARVQFSEILGSQGTSDEIVVIDRVLLDRKRWMAIRREVQREFNLRLKAHSLRPSTFGVGNNPVDRLLGKELCLLAWTVEYMMLDKIPIAIRNWLALRPEERWWLFGMTAVSSGGINDGERGWRVALRHALGDNVQNEQLSPISRLQLPVDENPATDKNYPSIEFVASNKN